MRLVAAAVVMFATLTVMAACSEDEKPAATPAGQACVPGVSVACVGAGGCAGGQACKADGSGYDGCVCGAPVTPTPGTDGGSTPTPGTDGGSSSGGDASATTGTATTGGQRVTWTLKKAGQDISCATAGAESISVLYTPIGSDRSTEKKLPCAPGEGTTTDLPFGKYKVSIAAVNGANQGLGEDAKLEPTFAATPCDAIVGTSCIQNVTVTLPVD